MDVTTTITGIPGASHVEPGPQLVEHLALGPARTNVLDHDDAKDQRHEQDHQELVVADGLVIHFFRDEQKNITRENRLDE